jgi:hypothetical protein
MIWRAVILLSILTDVLVCCAIFRDQGPAVYHEPDSQFTDSENQHRFGAAMVARDAGRDGQS